MYLLNIFIYYFNDFESMIDDLCASNININSKPGTKIVNYFSQNQCVRLRKRYLFHLTKSPDLKFVTLSAIDNMVRLMFDSILKYKTYQILRKMYNNLT